MKSYKNKKDIHKNKKIKIKIKIREKKYIFLKNINLINSTTKKNLFLKLKLLSKIHRNRILNSINNSFIYHQIKKKKILYMKTYLIFTKKILLL